jgi:hypothetical protein
MCCTHWKTHTILINYHKHRSETYLSCHVCSDCSISINKLRGGIRHDIWIALKNIKTGRIHVAVTVLEEENEKVRSGFTSSW